MSRDSSTDAATMNQHADSKSKESKEYSTGTWELEGCQMPPEIFLSVLEFLSTESLMRFLIECFYSSPKDTKNRDTYLSAIKTELVLRRKRVVPKYFDEQQAELVEFLNGAFQHLEPVPRDEKEFVSAARKCCILLAYIHIVLSNKIKDKGSIGHSQHHLLWPIAVGDCRICVRSGRSQIQISFKILLSTPIPWSASIISQFEKWLKNGDSANLFVTETPDSATQYIALATFVSGGPMIRKDGSLAESGFAYLDETSGDDGMCYSLQEGDNILTFLTDAFANSVVGPLFNTVLSQSNNSWLANERVPGRNCFVTWGWEEDEFKDQGPYDAEAVIDIIAKIVSCCNVDLNSRQQFHK